MAGASPALSTALPACQAQEDGPKPVSVEDTIDEEDRLFRIMSPKSPCLGTELSPLLLENHLSDVTNGAGEPGAASNECHEALPPPDSTVGNEATASSTVQDDATKRDDSSLVQTVPSPRPVPHSGDDVVKSPARPAIVKNAITSPLSMLSDVSTAITADIVGNTPAIATAAGPNLNRFPNNHQAYHGQNWAGQRSPGMMFPGHMQHGAAQMPQGYPPFQPLHTPQLPYALLSPMAQSSRMEPPMPSGYDLVARKLAGQGPGMSLPPLYRRFKTLNHRLLLGIQDELCYLEELLSKQDTNDAQSRTYFEGTVPASRRQESLEPNEITIQRQATLETIAFKLTQYSTFLCVTLGPWFS